VFRASVLFFKYLTVENASRISSARRVRITDTFGTFSVLRENEKLVPVRIEDL